MYLLTKPYSGQGKNIQEDAHCSINSDSQIDQPKRNVGNWVFKDPMMKDQSLKLRKKHSAQKLNIQGIDILGPQENPGNQTTNKCGSDCLTLHDISGAAKNPGGTLHATKGFEV